MKSHESSFSVGSVRFTEEREFKKMLSDEPIDWDIGDLKNEEITKDLLSRYVKKVEELEIQNHDDPEMIFSMVCSMHLGLFD